MYIHITNVPQSGSKFGGFNFGGSKFGGFKLADAKSLQLIDHSEMSTAPSKHLSVLINPLKPSDQG
jgi:hypothetical protein